MAALVLVSLCAVCISSASVSAAGSSSSANAQPSAALVGAPIPIGSSPAVVGLPEGLALFVKGTDGALWWKLDAWEGSGWADWKSLGGILTSNPAAVSRGAGVIVVYVRGADGALWRRGTVDGGATWLDWNYLGGQLLEGTGPTAYAWTASGNERLGVFVTGMDRALWHRWSDAESLPGLHDWESLGGYLTSSPAAASSTSGVIDVFVRGGDNGLWQREYNNGWQPWTSLGGIIYPGTGPAACSWFDSSSGSGRLDVFVEGMDSALYHRGNDGAWSGWESLGGILTSSPGVASPHAHREDVFVRGTDGALWWKTSIGPTWYDWGPVGGGGM
jgi:hypothetical protein